MNYKDHCCTYLYRCLFIFVRHTVRLLIAPDAFGNVLAPPVGRKKNTPFCVKRGCRGNLKGVILNPSFTLFFFFLKVIHISRTAQTEDISYLW